MGEREREKKFFPYYQFWHLINYSIDITIQHRHKIKLNSFTILKIKFWREDKLNLRLTFTEEIFFSVLWKAIFMLVFLLLVKKKKIKISKFNFSLFSSFSSVRIKKFLTEYRTIWTSIIFLVFLRVRERCGFFLTYSVDGRKVTDRTARKKNNILFQNRHYASETSYIFSPEVEPHVRCCRYIYKAS